MNVPERLTLLDDLWDSIATDQDLVPITDAQREDLSRRLEAIDADPSRGSTWEEVTARLMGGS